MPVELLALSALPPLLAALTIGLGLVTGRIAGERCERWTAGIALTAAGLSTAMIAAAALLKLLKRLPDHVIVGPWLASGDYVINLSFSFDTLSLSFAALIAAMALITLRFSVNYMHREAGYHRFFLCVSLFIAAMLLLATAGNVALAFAGWELAGVSSYLLIAYAYDRPVAAANATRAFVTNRIGDVGFVLAIFLSYRWAGGLDWPVLMDGAEHLSEGQVGLLAGCFLLAAIAKSAQVPLTQWLARAMEGPTPSSAIFYGSIMIHAGVFLVLRLQPVFDLSPTASLLMVLVGLSTAFYGFFCGLAQTDVKSALIFSTSAQVGLMFAEAGLGLHRLALWHLAAHGVFRGYQFLTAPSLMHQILGLPPRSVPALLARCRRLYVAALQRLWLEAGGDWLAVRPVQRLAADMDAFDKQFVEPAIGLPATAKAGLSTPEIGLDRPEPDPDVIRVSGLAGTAVGMLASLCHWFEHRLVLQGIGEDVVRAGRRLGRRLNGVETLLNQPRYLVAFIIATLLAAF